jgi:hypothetical protein
VKKPKCPADSEERHAATHGDDRIGELGDPPPESDPVIAAYKRDVDRTLIRENLKRSIEERLEALVELQQFAAELRRAGREIVP